MWLMLEFEVSVILGPCFGRLISRDASHSFAPSRFFGEDLLAKSCD